MSIITLLSDYGTRGSKIAKAKGLLLSELSTASIIDISHEISPFNIVEAAYITKRSYSNFPRNTIHIIDVDAQHNPEQVIWTVAREYGQRPIEMVYCVEEEKVKRTIIEPSLGKQI